MLAAIGVTLDWEIRRIGMPAGNAGDCDDPRRGSVLGGISAEREVCPSSGAQVIAALA